MSVFLQGGPRTWGGERDDDGYRTFTVAHLVGTTDVADGPFTVMNCPGLPQIGSYWAFGNDSDIWCFCYPTMKITIHQEKEGDPTNWYKVEQKFSNKPLKRCQDTSIEDPLQEPDRLSGGFARFTEEATHDRFGALIQSSSWELFRGPQVEFDRSRQTIKVSQNRSSLESDLCASMQDTLNDSPLWGYNARCIKFNMPSWERKLYGTCTYYYSRDLEFETNVNPDGSSGFDRDILDEGSKCLKGHWDNGSWVLENINGSPPNRYNLHHFQAYLDVKGNAGRVILDGTGLPADSAIVSGTAGSNTGTDSSGQAYNHHIEKYFESNFLLLGIPTSL